MFNFYIIVWPIIWSNLHSSLVGNSCWKLVPSTIEMECMSFGTNSAVSIVITFNQPGGQFFSAWSVSCFLSSFLTVYHCHVLFLLNLVLFNSSVGCGKVRHVYNCRCKKSSSSLISVLMYDVVRYVSKNHPNRHFNNCIMNICFLITTKTIKYWWVLVFVQPYLYH